MNILLLLSFSLAAINLFLFYRLLTQNDTLENKINTLILNKISAEMEKILKNFRSDLNEITKGSLRNLEKYDETNIKLNLVIENMGVLAENNRKLSAIISKKNKQIDRLKKVKR